MPRRTADATSLHLCYSSPRGKHGLVCWELRHQKLIVGGNAIGLIEAAQFVKG
jgi:hypothetical protein